MLAWKLSYKSPTQARPFCVGKQHKTDTPEQTGTNQESHSLVDCVVPGQHGLQWAVLQTALPWDNLTALPSLEAQHKNNCPLNSFPQSSTRSQPPRPHNEKVGNIMARNASFRSSFKDMRRSLPQNNNSTTPISSALVRQLPFPNGVVPECLVTAFLELMHGTEAEKEQVDAYANSSANGPAIDSLVILFRLVLALGLDPKTSLEPRLFELAFHDFGRNIQDDYIVKGRLLDILYPLRTIRSKRVEDTLGELVRHPLVKASLWSHPSLQFFNRHTWAKKVGKSEFEPHKLDRQFVFRDLHFFLDDNYPRDLGKYFSRMLGIRNIDGDSVAFTGAMPFIIPLVMKGGWKLKHIRSFTVAGPHAYSKLADGTLAPETKKRCYHLRAVLNLAESDIRMYYQDTSPVAEWLDLGPGSDNPQAKLKRGEHAQGWTFENGAPCYFLLIYAKYYDSKARPYQPPNHRFGEIPGVPKSGMS